MSLLWRALSFVPRVVAGVFLPSSSSSEEGEGERLESQEALEEGTASAPPEPHPAASDPWDAVVRVLRGKGSRGGLLVLCALPGEVLPEAVREERGERAWRVVAASTAEEYFVGGAERWLRAHAAVGRRRGALSAAHALVRVAADEGALVRVHTLGQDGLALEAGVPRPLVVEAAGSWRVFECRACGAQADAAGAHVARCVAEAQRPWCTVCGRGTLRPQAAFTGEPLAPRHHRLRGPDCEAAAAVLVLGHAEPWAAALAGVPPGVPVLRAGAGRCDTQARRLAQDAGLADALEDALVRARSSAARGAPPPPAAPASAPPRPRPDASGTITPARSAATAPRTRGGAGAGAGSQLAFGSPLPSPPDFGTPPPPHPTTPDDAPILTVAAAVEAERAARAAEHERRRSAERQRQWEAELEAELQRQRQGLASA